MASPFDDLKAKFPIWTIRNRLGIPSQLDLSDGDSVSFGPGATRKVSADKIHQVPALSTYELVSPSIKDLVEAGLIKKTAK